MSGILELWERVEKEWEEIKPEVCQNLIKSMPRRVQAMVRAKGGILSTINAIYTLLFSQPQNY